MSNVESRRIGEQSDICQSLVKSPAKRGNDDDLFRAQFDGAVDGKFEIRLIFIARDITRCSHQPSATFVTAPFQQNPYLR